MNLSKKTIQDTAKYYAKTINNLIESGKIQMPKDWSKEYHIVKGREILKGKVSWEGELPENIKEDKEYRMPVPVLIGHNVENRIKKALQKDGIEGMHNYFRKIGLKLTE